MAKIKYHFNPESFTVEKVKLSFRDRLRRISLSLVSGVVLSAAVLFMAYTFFDSPKERMMEQELAQIEASRSGLSERLLRTEGA